MCILCVCVCVCMYVCVNDSSERALAMATSFNGRITRYEESYQDMMLVVAAHRKKYGFKTKEDLKNFV